MHKSLLASNVSEIHYQKILHLILSHCFSYLEKLLELENRGVNNFLQDLYLTVFIFHYGGNLRTQSCEKTNQNAKGIWLKKVPLLKASKFYKNVERST